VTASEVAERLEARASRAGVALTTPQADRLAEYLELLRTWTRKINLTAMRLDPLSDEAVDRLIVEPLAAARVLSPDVSLPEERAAWVDVGSGGGSPAIPMKLALPRLSLTMIESKARKAAFLREVVRALKFEDVQVVTMRVEDIHAVDAPASLVTARAVRVDSELAVAVASLMKPSGRFAIFKTTSTYPTLLGFEIVASERLLPENPSWLHVYARMFHVEHAGRTR
jgi:16S rRNA (guanine527-N7)-methyltransferase